MKPSDTVEISLVIRQARSAYGQQIAYVPVEVLRAQLRDPAQRAELTKQVMELFDDAVAPLAVQWDRRR